MRRSILGLLAALLLSGCGTMPAASPPARAATAGSGASASRNSVRKVPLPAPRTFGPPVAVTTLGAEDAMILQDGVEKPASSGLVPRLGGLLSLTTSTGSSWTVMRLPNPYTYSGVAWFRPGVILILAETPGCEGLPGPCTGVVLKQGPHGGWTPVLTAPGVEWTAWTRVGAGGFWLSGQSLCLKKTCTPQTVFYRTETEGASWESPAHGTTVPVFQAFSATTATVGYALSGSAVFHTEDGGATWSRLGRLPVPKSPAAGFPPRFQASGGTIQVPTPGTLFISTCNGEMVSNSGCETTLFRSTDGGRTFQILVNRNCTEAATVHMMTPDAGVILYTGYTMCEGKPWSNVVWATQDGFSTMTRTVILPVQVSALTFFNRNEGWLAGYPLTCQFSQSVCPLVVESTDDGGSSWTPLPAPTRSVYRGSA